MSGSNGQTRLLPIREVAPPGSVSVPTRPDGRVWLLNLDQVESNSGDILAKTLVDSASIPSSTGGFDDSMVLYCKLRPYLNKVVLPDAPGYATSELVPLQPDPCRVDRRYLAQFLRSPKFVSWASEMVAGAKMPRLRMNEFWEYQIPVPALVEQKRIAGILDKADGIRRKRREAIQLADDLLRATFLEMFGDPVTNPKGWERVRLGDVLQDGPQNGLYKPASDYGTGTPILRIDAFYDGVVKDIGSLKRVRVSDSERKRFGLKANDIVVNRVNSMEYLGKSALIPDLQEPTVFESNMMRFRVETNLASPAFVVQFLQSSYIKSQIAQAAKHAVNQSSINQQDVGSFELLLPPVGLQTQFMSASKRIHALKHSCRAAVEHDDALFQSLMQRAFTGRL